MILLILIASLFPALGLAVPCVTFDSHWNLYAFGVQGQYNWGFGQQDSSWTSSSGPNVTTISSENAPPMNGNNTQCFNIEFFNAIYVLDGDSANPSNIHIFDADKQTWTVQTTTLDSGFDPTSAVAIIDHDTNVFFALAPNGDLYQLNMSNQNKAQSSPNKWQNINTANFKTQGYSPVMAIADNHIFFLDVPGNSAGDANLFVIHFNYFQPDVQAFDAVGGGSTFPATGGVATSIFQPDTTIDAQKQFAFFPNDGSNTYVVDVIHNATSSLPYPPAPPSSGFSSFAGSDASLVQLTPSGELYFLNLTIPKTGATTASGGWTKINNGQWHQPSASQIASATPNPTGTGGPQSTGSGSSKSAGFVNTVNMGFVGVVGAMVLAFAL